MTQPSLPDIDFHQIRPHGTPATRSAGFEEVASLVIKDGIPGLVDWPTGVSYHRFGNPDGGREGNGVLDNGDVWAWQAKYLFAFGTNEVAQVHESVVRTLDTEPDLKRYFVALPYDLPAGDTTRKGQPVKSAHTRWEEKKEEWRNLATSKGVDVEFLYIGASQLAQELTKIENAGRVRYWFGASVLSPIEQQHRLEDVINKAGRRYTPKLHVEVEPVRALEGLGRSEGYIHRIQSALASLRRARNASWRAPADDADLQTDLDVCIKSLTDAEVALEGFLDIARRTGPLPDITAQVAPVETALTAVSAKLARHLRDGRYYVGNAAFVHSSVSAATEAYWTVLGLLRGADTTAAGRGLLLMTGRAGVGKTHLFCDVASRRVAEGRPTVVVLGQDFDDSPLLSQIGRLAQIDGHLDNVLQVLDAAGEAAGRIAMLMLDAINEGAKADRWRDDLRVLAGAVARYPNVVLAVSCRTEFVEPVVGKTDLPIVKHRGFAEATTEAVDRYTAEYGLERLAFPILNPEFSNGLFLKLACEALSTLGQSRFTLGAAGLTTVCEAFLEAVNERLATASRCDYDKSSQLVRAVARELAALGASPYTREQVIQIADNTLPNRTWSKSLYAGLLNEGVLLETHENNVVFSYQRLGDILRAVLIAEKPLTEVTTWYNTLDARTRWAESGVIGALAIIVPERLNVEIVDLLKDNKGAVHRQIIDAFLQSLTIRSPEYTTERTAKIVAKTLTHDDWQDDTWETLLRIACIPGHKTNADWLHQLLLDRPLPDRDQTWSEWLAGSLSRAKDYPVNVLLDWAWPARHDPNPLAEDTARLATLTIGWMLTTTDRTVRDRATKALVVVGERNPAGFAAAVKAFHGCDDPYVIERLTAAVCALALRSTEPDAIIAVADAAAELIHDGVPVHLATRDYLRRTADAAREHGWAGPNWTPPYGSTWPVDSLPYEQIKQMAGAPDYKYSSIWASLAGHLGDFGRYILEPAIERFNVADHRTLQHEAERIIFTRAVHLGWTPERFAYLDQGRRGGQDGQVERYGKKYQWIGLHEVLARLADNHQLKERWVNDGLPFDYDNLTQLLYRDIDASVLIRGGVDNSDRQGAPPWFAPAAATFPVEVVTDYPQDLDGVPDPLDLIALTDPDGTHWLSLIRYANWNQDLPPEIAALNAPTLNVWMQIRSYLIATADIERLRMWAAENGGRDYDGRWMPEHAEIYSRLLANHPSSPDWDYASGDTEHNDRVPVTLYVPNSEYLGTGTSRDTTDDITGQVPSGLLYETLQLNHGIDFVWTDTAGPAVFDPTAGMKEASTLLLRRDLADTLATAGYSLFWTVLLNKQRNEHGLGAHHDENYRWLSASASYILSGNTIERVAATASRRRPAPGGDPQPIPWVLRAYDQP